MQKRRPLEPTGMGTPPNKEANPLPVVLREESRLAVKMVVTSIGGVTAAACRFGVTRQTVHNWLNGRIGFPPDIAKDIAQLAADLSGQMREAANEAIRLEARAIVRRDVIRRAARQRYYERFGRYPVPARGGKTP
jgi:transposase-like protein